MSVLDDMRQAARLAGELLLRRQSGLADLQVESKGVKDFVTSVDREAEEIIATYLEERWPGIPFLAEESDARKTDAAERWIVDPLDGTTNYIHGFPVFCVSIAFESSGRLRAGVVLDPTRDELFCAEHGDGATLNGAPLSVSEAGDLGSSLLATGFPFREIERLDGYLSDFRRLLAASAGVRRAGSAAMDLCYVAAGRCDGFWEIGLSPWDVAAGGLMVLEAGGRVTDFGGGGEWLNGREIVAAAPGIYTAILEVLGRTPD